MSTARTFFALAVTPLAAGSAHPKAATHDAAQQHASTYQRLEMMQTVMEMTMDRLPASTGKR